MPFDPVATSVWVRPHRPRGAQPSLGREQIVRAALELLDADGIDGLSMRRLGARLNAGATSIYWYVANKDDLLELAVDEVWGEVPLPDGDGWRDVARALVVGIRSAILRHPWVTTLLGRRPSLGPNAMRLADLTLASLTAGGFSPTEAAHASSLLMAHAAGSATMESARRTVLAQSTLSPQEFVQSMEANLPHVATEYPQLAEWNRRIHALDVEKLWQEEAEFGLKYLLAGLELVLAEPGRDWLGPTEST